MIYSNWFLLLAATLYFGWCFEELMEVLSESQITSLADALMCAVCCLVPIKSIAAVWQKVR